MWIVGIWNCVVVVMEGIWTEGDGDVVGVEVGEGWWWVSMTSMAGVAGMITAGKEVSHFFIVRCWDVNVVMVSL